MKISSASKKVLASALSAAMVVAFAPAVALAAPAATTTAVSITADDNNGTCTKTTSAGMLQYDSADGKYYVTAPAATSAQSDGASAGYAFDKWFIDADGDGVLDKGEKYAAANGNIEVPAGTTAVTLKAAYKAPEVSRIVYDATHKLFSAVLNETAQVAGLTTHTYKLTVTNSDGLELGSATIDPTAFITSAYNVGFVVFGTGADINILPGLQTSGEYTFTLTDTLTATKAVKAVSSKKYELAKVTIDNGAAEFVSAGDYTLPGANTVNYVDASGNYIGKGGDTVTVKGDVTFKTTAAAQTVSGVTYTAGANKQLGFTLLNVANAVKYVANVEGPGFSKEYTYTTAEAVSEAINEAAGTWTVSVAAYDKTGYQLATGKATMALTEIKYDAAAGTFTAGTPAQKDYFTTNTTVATVAAGLTIKAADGYVFDKWTLNGKEFKNGDSVVAGQVNTITATYTEVKQAAAPEYSIAKNSVGGTDYYTLSVTPAAGTTVAVDGTGVTKNANGTWNLASTTATVTITASAAGAANKEITLNKTYGNDYAGLTAWNAATKGGTSVLSLAIGNGTAKWNAVEAVAAAVTAGDAAIAEIQGKYYASDKEIAASDLASAKALYEAVAAEATAQVAAYADGAYVVAGDNAYVMTKTQYDAAKKAVADAAHAVELNVAAGTNAQKTAAYMAGVTNVVNNTNAALKTAGKAPVTKADIEAAAAVSAELAAAKTGAEADAALAKFAALTDAQKALVSGADVAAAQKVADEAKAAAELVAAQDKAAVNYVNSTKTKTVKLATAKKGTATITYKSKVSASGNTVTYAKVSGAKIKVAASGKVTLKKVTKKGTYTGKVKVTCGDATRTVKVKFFVK